MTLRPRVPIYDPGLPIQRKVLKNGVVLLVQEQRTSEDVAAMVALRMGTLYEDDQTAGLSQVLMASLTAGTKKLSPADLAVHLLARNATLESGASADYGQVGLQTRRGDAPEALELLAQIVLSPSFPDTAVESARSAFLAKAADDVESPMPATYSTFLSALYRGSPLARPPHGTVQALSEARRPDILALYSRLFVGGNMAVSVVGNIDGKKTMAQLEKLFLAAPAGPPPTPAPGVPEPLAADTVITGEKQILAQSLVYGYPAPGYADSDYAAFMILDSYLRSADRSPIMFWMPQREQAGAVAVMFPPYPRRSSLAVSLGTQPAKYAAARDTVAAVLGRLKTEPLDAGEWGVHVKRVQSAYFWKQNEPARRARNLSRWEVQGVTLEYPRQFETALLKLKPEDVRDAAARWFTHAAEVTLKPAGNDGQP
jgi:predicted Zn-dependent peptidase